MTTKLATANDILEPAGADIAEPETPPAEAAAEDETKRLAEYLPAPLEQTTPAPAAPAGLRSARLIGVSGRVATLQVRGEDEVREISLDPDVDAAVVEEALENGDRAMVETNEEGELVVVGVLKCRQPERVRIAASVVEIEAEREVVMRSGRSAMRLREDGDVELVGSRISAASRGLFRLVGRMLRLN